MKISKRVINEYKKDIDVMKRQGYKSNDGSVTGAYLAKLEWELEQVKNEKI